MGNERYPRGFKERPRVQHEVWENTVPNKATGSSSTGAVTEIERGATWTRGIAAVDASVAPVVYIYVPGAMTITRATTLTAGGTGSCVIDVWVDTYANFPPTVADTITASAKPTISSGTKDEDSTLTGWDTSVAAGSVIAFKLESSSTFTQVSITLTMEPT